MQNLLSKEEGKGQESIQSSTTPDPGHHMGNQHHIQEGLEVRPPNFEPLTNVHLNTLALQVI